ncbi:glycosyltransferase family 2 protein [Candidatus Amesbacteria bacterium]|nr:glycosyltransferase family 2 protein [Candidatus Amesbacteria bacterium]
MKIVVIIPTYNEKDNTPRMIEALARVFSDIKPHKMHLLYIDGNSPDGTADVIRKYQKKYDWLHVIVETKKEGLGKAYAKGMAYAMQELRADWLLEFDGDFQHPPESISELVKYTTSYDYILGSRYIKGGSIPKEWSLERKLLSVLGNLVARVLLILPNIHDVTGGFKLSRVKGFMDQFDFDKLLSKSFAYKIHLLYYMVQKGARVIEIPFIFGNRTSGESKIIKNELFETLRVIFLLQQRIVKFGVTGFIGYLVNAIFLQLLSSSGELLAWLVSTELAIISNFTINNLWTFRSEKISGVGKLLFKFLQFNLTSSGGLIIQSVLGFVVVTYLNVPRQLALPIIIGFIVLPYNYFMYTKVIWKEKAPNQK